MNTHLQLVLGLWFTAMCVFGVACFLVWLIMSLLRDAYRHHTKCNRFVANAAARRECITVMLPSSFMRDFKNRP